MSICASNHCPLNTEPTHLHDRVQGPAGRSPVALIPSTRNAECTGHRKTGMVLSRLFCTYICPQSSHDHFQNLEWRKKIFCTKYQLPDILAEARITSLTPLRTDGRAASTFGFVVLSKSNQQIMIL
jgi:hypothetical protein